MADFFPEDLLDDLGDDVEDFDDVLSLDFLPPVFFDRPGRRSASDETTDAARSAASVAASRALVTSRSSPSICSWSRATTSCATRSAVSRAACSAERSALLGSATAAAGVVVTAGVAAFEADFVVLVALAGAFFPAVLFVAVFVGAFFAVAFFAGERVVVFFDVVLSVSAMLLSIRAFWPGRNRGVETDQLSSCQFATTAAIGGSTAATADITTAAVVE